MIGCKCNRQCKWSEIAITNATAGLEQVYDLLVGASLTYMHAGSVQLLMNGCWSDSAATTMADGLIQLL